MFCYFRMDSISRLKSFLAQTTGTGYRGASFMVRLMMKAYDIVILDEPAAPMDMETTLLTENLIVDYIKETGCIAILVIHSLQQARHTWFDEPDWQYPSRPWRLILGRGNVELPITAYTEIPRKPAVPLIFGGFFVCLQKGQGRITERRKKVEQFSEM